MKAARTRVLAPRLLAAVLAVGVVLSLAACQPKTGAAAIVGGDRITQKDVQNWFDGSAATADKSQVLQVLVKTSLYEKFLTKNGWLVSDAELTAKYRDGQSGAVAIVSQGQATTATEAQLVQVVQSFHAKDAFAPVFIRAFELEAVAIDKLKATTGRELYPKVAAAGISVSVSPGYGSWDASTQEMSLSTQPDFLVPSPTASATPAG